MITQHNGSVISFGSSPHKFGVPHVMRGNEKEELLNLFGNVTAAKLTNLVPDLFMQQLLSQG